jgi:geranylgeranyl transferase type-2 subunit alpha
VNEALESGGSFDDNGPLCCVAARGKMSNNLVSLQWTAPPLLAHEFKYTTESIHANFSNYSAWHHRSVLLGMPAGAAAAATAAKAVTTKSDSAKSDAPPSAGNEFTFEDLVVAELQLVKQAIFTDPYDQSCWLYQRWLLGRFLAALSAPLPAAIPITTNPLTAQAAATAAATSLSASSSLDVGAAERVLSVLNAELQTVDELIGVEPNAKFALLSRAILLHCIMHYLMLLPSAASSAARERLSFSWSATELSAETVALLQRCAELDPMRQRYYQDMRDKLTRTH